MPENAVAVRFRLHEILAERKPTMSQSELSRRSGISLVTVHGIANNKTRRVDLNTLEAFSNVLGCAPGDLIEKEPEKKHKR